MSKHTHPSWTNYHFKDNDHIGVFLQNFEDYQYLKKVSPESIPPDIRKMWKSIKWIALIIWLILAVSVEGGI